MSVRKGAIIFREGIYVPKRLAKAVDLNKFTTVAFIEKQCTTCDFRDTRPNNYCEICNGFLGKFEFFKEVEVSGERYIKFQFGDIDKLKLYINIDNYIDLRTNVPMSKYGMQLELNKELYPYQKLGVEAMFAEGYGVLESKPRTGKTLMAIALLIELGKKAIVIAHQYDLLVQFYSELSIHTNLLDVEKFNQKRIAGICEKPSDFDRFEDIALSTYQKFLWNKDTFNKVKRKFSVVIIDEVHKGNARRYREIISSMSPQHTFGFTATPETKHGLEFIMKSTVGEVKYVTKTDIFKPIVQLIDTKFGRKIATAKTFQTNIKYIESHPERLLLISKTAARDAIQNKRSILIPITLSIPQAALVAAINKCAGKDIAESFHGKLSNQQKTEVLDNARSGKTLVIVAKRRMLLGINVPLWDMLYEISPIANPPNFWQEILRICTPNEGKPQPVIKFFIDIGLSISTGCFNTCIETFIKHDIKFTSCSNPVLKQIKRRRPSNMVEIDSENTNSTNTNIGRRF